jgi:rfaE bifunctional protein kinase chain/domain
MDIGIAKEVALAASLASARLLVIGDVMLDRYWFGDTSRISPEAPVPVVLIENRDERLGGAANVARNAAALGAKVGMIGIVGDDEPGRTIRRQLAEIGVEASLETDSALATTVKLRILARRQQVLRIDMEGQPAAQALAGKMEAVASMLPRYPVIALSDYGKGALQHVSSIISLAREAGKITIVDPKGDDYARYRGATILTPNRAELRSVIGAWHSESDLTRRAQDLRRTLMLNALLLTRSEEGMTLYSESGALHIAAQAREVYDVSGAGDTVVAALGVMLAAGVPLRDAVHYANRAGGIVVGKLGTSTLTCSELLGVDAGIN